MCSMSRSGFYYWIKHRHKNGLREQARQVLDDKVKEALDSSKGRNGARIAVTSIVLKTAES